MGKKTYLEVLSRASSFLEAQKKEGYSIQFLFLERKGWKKIDWLLHMNELITSEDENIIEHDMDLLLKNHPPQYLLGYADFYGHRLKVTEDTLIPRPETEELVELCLNETSDKELNVVDIGTGTGAIAISLKAERAHWWMSAIDLSFQALSVAKENAMKEQVPIHFYHGDTLEPVMDQYFDVIISNPPYISVDEWVLMDESVRIFEPKIALFAEDEGLAIYKKIAKESKEVLKPSGKIFLEIGYHQGIVVKQIFQEAFPTKKVMVKKDLFGNERMITVMD
ncbi:MAG: peptide chain release factor N(5)-glutamine methyltransferase [Enterococcus lacertideformus]|uniref:Release factor glutamine methyltransferase n=1 Tax=Enterococcus lacertideformus TaxID=2771493 RepID=A0A931B1E8_9ENTE|nr:peptide chain release factor N(5)-glutamine methyltransferase [Enterococcus lacertideformus]